MPREKKVNMDCNIEDILLELTDEMFNVKYDRRNIIITAPFSFKLKDVMCVLQRLFYYRNREIKFFLETKHKINGAVEFDRSKSIYNAKIDDTLFDNFYVDRIRGNKTPLYIRTKTEIKEVNILL